MANRETTVPANNRIGPDAPGHYPLPCTIAYMRPSRYTPAPYLIFRKDANLQVKPLLLIDVDGVISLFSGSGHPGHSGVASGFGTGPGVVRADRRHRPFPFGHGGRAPSGAGRTFRSRVVQRLGGEGRRVPPPPARASRVLAASELRRSAGRSRAHWKLDAIDAYARARAAGVDRRLRSTRRCRDWAAAREAGLDAAGAHRPGRGLRARPCRPARGVAPGAWRALPAPQATVRCRRAAATRALPALPATMALTRGAEPAGADDGTRRDTSHPAGGVIEGLVSRLPARLRRPL